MTGCEFHKTPTPAAVVGAEAPKRTRMDSDHHELACSTSRHYQRCVSSMSDTSSPTHPEFTYHHGAARRKRTLSWRRSHHDPLPEPVQGLVFHVYRTSSPLSKKTYGITLADHKTQAFHVTFPRAAFSLSSRPNILIQRGGSSGQVVGEVRYHSWNNDEILLPFISDGVAKLTTDGFFKKGRRIRFEGREWSWRQVSNRAEYGEDGVGEGLVNGRWRCTDAQGTVYGLMSRTRGQREVGRIAVTHSGLGEREIEALVVCALAMLEKEERRGSTSSSEGD